ncbi:MULTISPECIES: response regulator [Sphingomonas]|uniref:response regulator n=1 Tax=Sphingomonas TaxID=13687 RepID=UPI000DEF99E7|nr:MULTISPECIES: response regulator [Sphingomonas]
MHALIIENEPAIAFTIETILSDLGFDSFDVAQSSEAAMAFAVKTCPQLITADVELETGTGIDAVNVICSGPDIPVVFITGTPDEVRSKMPLYPLVVKPFRLETLVKAVETAMAHPV